MSLVSNDIARKAEVEKTTAGLVRKDRLKRFMDFAIVLPALLVLSPGLLAIAIMLLIVDGRPVFFKHKRIGRGGKVFECLKFRTMRRNADVLLKELLETDAAKRKEWEDVQKLKADPRVHTLGKYLRITSLDELPQLFNVLKGDMSLVGPRPIVSEEIERYGACLPYYLAMRPGITGLWQVQRRDDTTYDERIGMDVEYYHRCSLSTDLTIMWKTVGVVLFAQNER